MEENQLQGPRPGNRTGKILTGLLLILVGIFVGRYIVPLENPAANPVRISIDEAGQRQFVFPTFWEAWDALHEKSINEIDDKDLLYGAVAGMVRATGDPYTVFENPEDSKQFQETLSGKFSGVGIEIGARNGLVRVIAPLEGSPAQQAGVLAGDVIVAVDEEPITPDSTIDRVVQQIRGEQGASVTLKIARQENGETTTKDIEIIRDTITIESTRLNLRDDGIAVIELLTFNGDTDEQFTKIARELANNRPTGIILDVRNNPGGFLEVAVRIASNFLQPGTLVVSEKGVEEAKHVTKGSPILKDIPLVVLINGGSASASEIIAGALADQAHTPLIGTQSFGKGSVQELIPLKDGSSLRVTVAKWFTPSGRSISDEGIHPTVEVEDSKDTEDIDEQLERAVEELHQITNT